MDSKPKFINVSIPDGSRNLFLTVVKTKHIPGALGDVATRLGRAHVNILSTGDCSSPDNPESTLMFFVEAQDQRLTEDDITKVLRSSPFFLDCLVRKGGSTLMVDDFSFPLMFFPGGRGIILPQSGVTAMFQDLVELFGTGGESILYRAGASVGRAGVENLAKHFTEKDMLASADAYNKLYSALGWGKLETIDADPDFTRFRLKLFDGFESAGVQSSKPNCHFTRGLIAGSSERLLARPLECTEEECASVGDPYCMFVVSAKASER